MLRAVAQLPEAALVIVGEGEERPRLERLATGLGVASRVSWLGWVEEARALLATFDAFVLPSRFEGFPLSILEAQLAEVAVVASDVGSISETVRSGATGLLVPPDDPDRLAEALTTLAHDPDRRRQLGEAGRRLVLERFTAGHMAEQFERLYAEIAR